MTKDERRRHKIRRDSVYRYFKSPRYKMETIAEDRRDHVLRFTMRGEPSPAFDRFVPSRLEFVDWRELFPSYAQPSTSDLVLGVDFAFYDLED